MARPALRALLAALVALAVALTAACGGGGGGSGKDETQGLTPTQILQQSATAATDAGPFRIAFALKGTLDVTRPDALPSGLGRLLNGAVDLSGEGPVVPPDKASIDVSAKVSGIGLQVNLTRVGDNVYVGILGRDFKLALPAEQVKLLNFGDLYPTLVSWTTQPQEAGRETIDGTSVVKITGTLDPTKALTDLGPALGASGTVTPAQARRALQTATAEFWVATEDLRPRRVHVVLKGDGTGVVDGVGAIDLDLTADFTNWGEQVDIPEPSNAQPLDPNGLGGLLG
ncbi:MAG TPA: LppX_LprAFG lipoprotein [Miltoncostaea sp.]|nr:LppX_LprAFG lipoprotein [Miltoncostaea sp.]